MQVCYLEFDRKDIPMNKMVVTSLESKFKVFDLRTQHPTKGFASLTEKVCVCVCVGGGGGGGGGGEREREC